MMQTYSKWAMKATHSVKLVPGGQTVSSIMHRPLLLNVSSSPAVSAVYYWRVSTTKTSTLCLSVFLWIFLWEFIFTWLFQLCLCSVSVPLTLTNRHQVHSQQPGVSINSQSTFIRHQSVCYTSSPVIDIIHHYWSCQIPSGHLLNPFSVHKHLGILNGRRINPHNHLIRRMVNGVNGQSLVPYCCSL